jgi:hypothetical protein
MITWMISSQLLTYLKSLMKLLILLLIIKRIKLSLCRLRIVSSKSKIRCQQNLMNKGSQFGCSFSKQTTWPTKKKKKILKSSRRGKKCSRLESTI